RTVTPRQSSSASEPIDETGAHHLVRLVRLGLVDRHLRRAMHGVGRAGERDRTGDQIAVIPVRAKRRQERLAREISPGCCQRTLQEADDLVAERRAAALLVPRALAVNSDVLITGGT